MRRRRIHREHRSGEVNVTPLIDVVMCLIIFYLMVGKLATDRRTAVTLPETGVGKDAERGMLIVNVAKGVGAGGVPRVVVEGETVEGDEALRELVKSRIDADARLTVQIRAEQDFPFGVVAPIMRACTAGGAKNVWLAARHEAEGGTK